MQYLQRLEEISVKLAHRWNRLLSNKVLGPNMSSTFILLTVSFLAKHYTVQEWRRYHTFMHLDRMFTEFDKVRDKLEHPELVEFAIFLHDIIYVVGRKDNELESARLAKQWLTQMGAPRKTINIVRRLIMATRHLGKPLRTRDERLIADLDLAGFGLSWDQALGNALKVRAEYAHVPDDDFAKGHGKVIVDFVLRGNNLYHTEHFKKECGAKALENMRNIMRDMKIIAAHRGRP